MHVVRRIRSAGLLVAALVATGFLSHASAHDTVEDIFRVSFTGVKYNEMG